MKKYKLIDYATDRQIDNINYKTEIDADNARELYLKKQLDDEVIHNNLIVIDEINE